jgi:hypothetical protein
LGRLQDRILLFKILVGAKKKFFEICKQFVQRLQTGSPGLVYSRLQQAVRKPVEQNEH